jgi:hypothetical protein
VRRRDDRFRVQIGGGTPTRQRLHFVGEADVQALRVVDRVDGDGRQTHVGSRPRDADRDLAAIGDQQFSNGHDWIVLWLEMVRRAPAAYTLDYNPAAALKDHVKASAALVIGCEHR